MSQPIRTRLPRSAKSRSALSYAILIHRIRPQRSLGDAFEGRRIRPGARITQEELWPTPDHPEIPLLLEYAGSDRSGSGHRRSQHLYILWAYGRELNEWKELARVTGESLEWVEILRNVAMQQMNSSPRSLDSCTAAASRVLQSLDAELDQLSTEDRRNALGLLYEQFTARLVREGVQEPCCGL